MFIVGVKFVKCWVGCWVWSWGSSVVERGFDFDSLNVKLLMNKYCNIVIKLFLNC